MLSLAYKRGIRMRQVVHNPCRDVDLAKVPKRTKLLTDAEWNTVYKAMPEWIQCAMDISYLTSLRISDVLRLQEPANGVLEIRHQKTG